MNIYLVSNSNFSSNFYFIDEISLEDKKKFRPLSLEGENIARKIAKQEYFKDIERIYSDASLSCINSAKYLVEKLNQDVIITEKLEDIRIGDLNGKTVKMLSYFQEHDFDFKLNKGESLKEGGIRISSFIRNIINEGYKDIVIYLPKRCILAYLLNHTKKEYNLDEKLVLSYNDNIILGNSDDFIDILKLSYEKNELKNITVLNLEE